MNLGKVKCKNYKPIRHGSGLKLAGSQGFRFRMGFNEIFPGRGRQVFMIELILLDAGGVLFNNVTEDSRFFSDLSRVSHITETLLLERYSAADHLFETNAQSVVSVIEDIIRSSSDVPSLVDDMRWLDEMYLSHVVPVPGIFELIRKIRSTTSVSLALANNEAEHWDRLKNVYFQHFLLVDHVASSWHLGVCKPSDLFFSRALLECHADSEKVLMVDDNPDVISSAAAFGIKGHLFRTAELFAVALSSYLDDGTVRP
jgi:putative hydrolase of the HAD superfamily